MLYRTQNPHGGDIYEEKVLLDYSSNTNPFGTPQGVVDAMNSVLTEVHHYPDPYCRALVHAIAAFEDVPQEYILCGNGAAELIYAYCEAACPKCAVELAPTFSEYALGLKRVGCQVDRYTLQQDNDFDLDDGFLKFLMERKPDAVFLCNPNNPTGALHPREVLQQIVDIAREHQLIIFSDEIYDRLVMDGEEHVSIASLAPDLFCVTYSGLSKSHMIAGFRIGWMIMSGNKKMAKDYMEGIKMLSNMRLCSNVPAQSIVQTALGGHQSVRSYVVPGGRIREQRDYIYKALTDIPGISAVKPKAAFYIFPKIDVKKFGIVDDEQFALDLLRDKKILLIHGGGFNWKQPDHFRVVFLPRIEVLKESVEKMADFFSYYHQ